MRNKSNNKKPTAATPQAAQLKAIDRLIEREELTAASVRTDALLQQYPDYTPLLERQITILLRSDRNYEACMAAHRWTEIRPNSTAAWHWALQSYLQTQLLVSTCVAAERLHALGGDVPTHLLRIDWDELQNRGPFGQVDRDTLLRHEMSLVWLQSGQYQRAIDRLADEAFLPTRNNYISALFHSGRVAEALTAFDRLWQDHPSNMYALQSIIQLRLYVGDSLHAEGLAAPLFHTLPERSDDARSQLTGLLLLGENQKVLDVYRRCEDLSWYETEHFNPAELDHLAAVAHARLGELDEAGDLWDSILDNNENFVPASQNADNMKLPESEAGNYWFWPVQQWFPMTLLQKLQQAAQLSSDEAIAAAIRQAVDDTGIHNDYLSLVCQQADRMGYGIAQMILLERAKQGDASALQVLKTLLAIAAGNDKDRYTLARKLVEAGHLSARQPITMLCNGEVQEVNTFTATIDGEPRPTGLPKAAMAKLAKALADIRGGQIQTAIQKLTALLEKFPDNAVLLCNLAAAYSSNQQDDKAETLLRQAIELQPDYIIARCNLANMHLERGETEAAEQLIAGLQAREHFHIQEASFLYYIQILIYHAKGEDKSRDSCLQMLESLAKEYPETVEKYLHKLHQKLGHVPDINRVKQILEVFRRKFKR